MSKILYLSDDPQVPTGYGRIGRAFCRHFRDKNHDITVMAGSLQAGPFQPTKWEGIELWPIKDYGNIEQIRYLIREKKPDIMLLNADPRMFQMTAFMIDNEIRRQCPLSFYHLWDGPPFPTFNVPLYQCCDSIIAGSKFTHDLLQENTVKFGLPPLYYSPIGINTDLYKPQPPGQTEKFRQELLKAMNNRYNPEFIVGFVGRFIPRKRLWDMMRLFTKFAEGKQEKVLLLMHVTVQDYGGNLAYVQKQLFSNQPIVLSTAQGQPDEMIANFYNLFDVSINIANAEGFGMPLVESMSCGTPVIASNIAGPSGYVTNENGWLLNPVVSNLVGSPQVPFIEDVYVSDDDVINALEEAYSNRKLLMKKASKCRATIIKLHDEKDMVRGVEDALIKTIENFTPYMDYTLTEVK